MEESRLHSDEKGHGHKLLILIFMTSLVCASTGGVVHVSTGGIKHRALGSVNHLLIGEGGIAEP